jgi:hypothetical protein
MSVPIVLTRLAKVHAELGHFDEARRCIGEAQTEVQATKATLFEAELKSRGKRYRPQITKT